MPVVFSVKFHHKPGCFAGSSWHTEIPTGSERTSTCELLSRHTDVHVQGEERGFSLSVNVEVWKHCKSAPFLDVQGEGSCLDENASSLFIQAHLCVFRKQNCK